MCLQGVFASTTCSQDVFARCVRKMCSQDVLARDKVSVENCGLRTERVGLRRHVALCGSQMHPSKMQPQPRRATSIAAMSIFFICIIASNARSAAAGSGPVTAFVRAIGVICQDNPHLSLHQPHALSSPPLPTIAFQ